MMIYRIMPFLYITSYVFTLFFMKQINLDPNLKALMRFSISFMILSPLFIFNRDKLKTSNHGIYMLRSLIAACAVLLTYKVYNGIPFTSATSISLSEPLFSALFSFMLLRENISFKKWIMIFLGYIGVLVSIWPIDLSNKYLLMQGLLLLANVVVSFNSVIIKSLSTKENSITVLFYMYMYMIPVLLFVNLIIGNDIFSFVSWANMRNLLIIGALGSLNNVIMITALKKLPVSTFTSAQYFRIFLATFLSFYSGEQLSMNEIIGSIIIVISSIFI